MAVLMGKFQQGLEGNRIDITLRKRFLEPALINRELGIKKRIIK